MKNIPTKMRGFIWLVLSLPLLGVFGFFTFIYWIKAIIDFGRGLYTFFLTGPPNINNLYILFALLGICLLLYICVCYGVMQIIASYKEYSFTKTRILTLAFSIGSMLVFSCFF